MHQARAAMFLYCVSPVHMGSGAALGVVDDPIQRERHNNHPFLAGSGLEGALRHRLLAAGEEGPGQEWIERAFGPAETDRPRTAGSLSCTDAQLVAFPVRSVRHSFVWVSSPTTLARVKRLCTLAGVPEAESWQVPEPGSGRALVADPSLLLEKRLVLEAFEFEASKWAPLRTLSEALARIAFPGGQASAYFRKKFARHLCVVSEAELDHFVQNSVLVETRVATGDGAVRYTENVPPEAVFVSLAMASAAPGEGSSEGTTGRDLLQRLAGTGDRGGLDGGLLQVGADGACGHGQVVLSFAGEDVRDG